MMIMLSSKKYYLVPSLYSKAGRLPIVKGNQCYRTLM